MVLRCLRWLLPLIGLLASCTVMPVPSNSTGSNQSAIDIQSLWNFADPALSEQRFRSALATANPDDTLILQTQIARSHGLRRDFVTSRKVLDGLRPQLTSASAEARVRHALEWGRSHASGSHQPEEVDNAARQQARASWQRALDLARAHGLDGLAVDTIHMFAFVDTTPAQQQHWAEQALALVLASQQPNAQRWQASIRNNLGLALQNQGRHEDALTQFRQALDLRRPMGNAQNTLVAGYMVARSLRSLGRLDEALVLQQQLLRDSEALGSADVFVLDELALLYRARGDAEQATATVQRAAQLRMKAPQ